LHSRYVVGCWIPENKNSVWPIKPVLRKLHFFHGPLMRVLFLSWRYNLRVLFNDVSPQIKEIQSKSLEPFSGKYPSWFLRHNWYPLFVKVIHTYIHSYIMYRLTETRHSRSHFFLFVMGFKSVGQSKSRDRLLSGSRLFPYEKAKILYIYTAHTSTFSYTADLDYVYVEKKLFTAR
jgi:hypothetical protein